MQTVIHSFELNTWKFMVVADVNRSTGMCLLDLYATTHRSLTRADLKLHTLDELLDAMIDVQMRNHVSGALRDCKRDLVAEHARELRFIHVLNQALHTIKNILRKGGSAIYVERLIAKTKRRLFSSLYKMGIVRGFRFEMARKLVQSRESSEISHLFSHLEKSHNALAKQVHKKCEEADFDTWRAVSTLASGHFNERILQKQVPLYSSDWINLRSFVVERTYLGTILDFCTHFVADELYRKEVIANETFIFSTADERKAS